MGSNSDRTTTLGSKSESKDDLKSLPMAEVEKRLGSSSDGLRQAEAYLGHKVNKAVITVPAYFNDAQRPCV